MSTPTCVHVCSFEGCDKTFSRRDRLIIHQRTHTGDRPYVCDCGKSYARSSHLTRHKETAHTSTIVQPLLCEEEGCNQTFTTKQALKKHLKRRHEQKLYKCTYEGCNRLFNKHQHLTVHEYEHTNVKPFTCTHENCGKSFLLPSKLKQHMKVHSGYPCDEEGCEEKFDKWTSLRRHKYQQHPMVYTCTECDKTFTQKNAFQQHLKSHSKEREVFNCPKPNCGRMYIEQRNLMAHIKSYHDGHRFHCEFEGCDKNFTTKQKCQKHFLLHEMNRPVPKKKSKKGVKKKSCASSVTGVDAKLINLASVEDRIRLSESDSAIDDTEISHVTGSQFMEYCLESLKVPFNELNESDKEYALHDEIDMDNNSPVNMDIRSVQDMTSSSPVIDNSDISVGAPHVVDIDMNSDIPLMNNSHKTTGTSLPVEISTSTVQNITTISIPFINSGNLTGVPILVDLGHVFKNTEQNGLENEQLSSEIPNNVLEESGNISLDINQCHLESSVLKSAIPEINSQFCINDKTTTDDDTQYDVYHRGVCS